MVTELQRLAELRTASHKHRLEKNTPIRPDFEILGLIAEKTVADALGLTLQDYVTPGKSDPGYDFVLADGTRIDVKGTDLPNGNLLVSADGKMTADVYVLVIVDKSTECGIIKGWIDKEEVLASPLKTFGYNHASPVYFVGKEKLHPMTELFL